MYTWNFRGEFRWSSLLLSPWWKASKIRGFLKKIMIEKTWWKYRNLLNLTVLVFSNWNHCIQKSYFHSSLRYSGVVSLFYLQFQLPNPYLCNMNDTFFWPLQRIRLRVCWFLLQVVCSLIDSVPTLTFW